jgi:hypothetical protein
VATVAPAADGGTVTPGLYYLTALTAYTGPGGAAGPATGETAQAAIQYEATGAGGSMGTLNVIASSGKNCPTTETDAITFSGGASLTALIDCPLSCGNLCNGVATYTATSGSPPTFTLFMQIGDSGGSGEDGGSAYAGPEVEAQSYTWQHS